MRVGVPKGRPPPVNRNDPVLTVTARYLARGSRVLEGGCGRANKVNAMAAAGFHAIGIDFAPQSVTQAKLDYPGLDIRLGDVRSLEFPDGSFDGYWSIGVIEHFWEGYADILSEAGRILRPQGIPFSHGAVVSPYRQRKARQKRLLARGVGLPNRRIVLPICSESRRRSAAQLLRTDLSFFAGAASHLRSP